ncbi:hypothetical protein BUALT_Bualt03G0061700 [Buddleja alternifolia]|uniref:Plus3 domain-containing protein n=1 Tax=Buddleja alternifolia TaxID=168488 RepID=A0AAV6XZM9_9LAMI|nr:hypothetical protein BUALT_Bualt03G0061700 [Buddleja alternifolia]
MADLEKLLLEAAGRTTTSGRNRHSSPPSRRRRRGSYSDDGSDSKNDDSDGDRGYSNRKPSGSQVPLKKRGPSDRDDDRSSQEHDEDEYDHERDSDNDSVGSDLYKDEDDREKLAKLTELEREMILEARATKRSDRDLTEKLKKRKGQDRKGSPPKAHTRNMRSKAERAGALDELVKRRRDAAKGGSSGRYSPVKRRSFTTTTTSSPSRSESGSHSDGNSTGDGGMADSDEDKMSSQSKVPTFEDINEITIRRSKLAKWFMEPFFDELIVGCFVRVGIGKSRTGPIYRLCVVRNVDASDPDRQYKLDNKTTHKYLNVVWGNESSAARWQMAMISDSPPKKEEFDQWVREVERSGGHMPTKQEVLDKKDAIQKTNSFVYSAATVKQMLQEKKSATWRPLNVAAEKDRLRRSLEVAKENDDEAEVERIKTRLQELEASRQAKEKDSKAVKLAEMNRRNRVENFKNASELKPVNIGLKAGEAGYDPFSRRWTRSRNYYVPNSNGGEAAIEANGDATAAVMAGSNGGVRALAETGIAATEAALEAAAGAGKLVDTRAPVDQGTESNLLHNFDLPISLAVLQKFGGPQGAQAGFMARKQMIEATIGVKVPVNDGRRHALTLTDKSFNGVATKAYNSATIFCTHLPFPPKTPASFLPEDVAGESRNFFSVKEESSSTKLNTHLPLLHKNPNLAVSVNRTTIYHPRRRKRHRRGVKTARYEDVKQFESRVMKFFKPNSSDTSSCKFRFFMTWISSRESFGDRELFSVESLFSTHPNGCLIVVSDSLDSRSGMQILRPFLDKGFKVTAIAPDFNYLFKNTPGEAWYNRLMRGNVNPGGISLGQNLSNLLRIGLLYRFGGVYLDTDIIVLKSFGELKNAIGAQTVDLVTGNWSRLNNAVMIFDEGHPLLRKFIEEFALTFDGNKWGHNGPYLVSRVVSRVSGRPGYNFTVLLPMAFYPVDWSKIGSLFEGPKSLSHSKWLLAKLRHIKSQSFAVHLWNKQSKGFKVEKVMDNSFVFLIYHIGDCLSFYNMYINLLQVVYLHVNMMSAGSSIMQIFLC